MSRLSYCRSDVATRQTFTGYFADGCVKKCFTSLLLRIRFLLKRENVKCNSQMLRRSLRNLLYYSILFTFPVYLVSFKDISKLAAREMRWLCLLFLRCWNKLWVRHVGDVWTITYIVHIKAREHYTPWHHLQIQREGSLVFVHKSALHRVCAMKISWCDVMGELAPSDHTGQ